LFRKLQDGVGAPDVVIGRARALHEFIKPQVIADSKNMYNRRAVFGRAGEGHGEHGDDAGRSRAGSEPQSDAGSQPESQPWSESGGGGLGRVPAFVTLVTNRDAELRKMIPR
jgi:hypothetical protein